MKNILAFSLITVVFICYCNGEIAYKNAHDLIEVIQNKAKVYGLDDMPTIIENRDTLKGIPEFKILENEVCSDWESAGNRSRGIEPEDSRHGGVLWDQPGLPTVCEPGDLAQVG